jgi:hypothetical protein
MEGGVKRGSLQWKAAFRRQCTIGSACQVNNDFKPDLCCTAVEIMCIACLAWSCIHVPEAEVGWGEHPPLPRGRLTCEGNFCICGTWTRHEFCM